ncbi:MAG: hypothetical protein HFP81_08325 [Methylococcales symbiont of Hymedesmia sp. n. MRB-2018]|nr:MAG: hypothetical protein HFP78_08545 [Methylococcales symbiont of Hymedesmia sp. n. MRB-2018]KAF3983251.1 MAG: hypothetical protein HFP81_08325 [Methylococcales symbiont of Hymedesmia sp. n. MRB-2018]
MPKFFIVAFSKKLLLGFLLYAVLVPVAFSIDIIVNTSVPIQRNSLNKTRAIFAQQLNYWSNGEKTRVFIFKDDHPLHKQFTKNKLNMFPHQLRRVWDRMVFSGTGQAPDLVETEEEMLEKIANTKNAIGYLTKGSGYENIRLFEYE